MPQDVQRTNNLSISNLPEQWKPPTEPLDWKPPTAPISGDEPKSNSLQKAFEYANTPLVSIMSPQMREISKQFAQPGLEDTPLSAGLKGFASGSIESLADLMSAQSSPLSLGLSATGVGALGARAAGLEGLGNALSLPGKLATGGMVGHGLYNIATAPDAYGKLGGGIEAALGGAGLGHFMSSPKVPLSTPETAPVQANKLSYKGLPLSYENLPPVDEDILKMFPSKNQKNIQPSIKPEKPLIKDFFIKNDKGELVLNPKYQTSKIEKPTIENLVKGETGAIRIRPSKQPQQPIIERQPALQKLIQAINSSSEKRGEQEKLYSSERAKRIAAADAIKTPGFEGLYKQLHHLKGPLPKVNTTSTKLSTEDINSLTTTINNSQQLLPFEKINAKLGLLKLVTGKEVPQRYELGLLREVFGKDFDQIIEMHGGLGGPISKKVLLELVNAPKAIMSSVDLSAPLRQGLPLIHKSEFWNSLKPMLKAAASKENFDAIQKSILDRPNYLVGKEAGLKLTNMETMREEAYGSFAEHLPLINHSERAFVAFLNKLRSDTFDTLWKEAKVAGVNLTETITDKQGNKLTEITSEGKEIARFVNNATGRGDLGRFNKMAPELNAILYSPRLIASRLTILNPKYYIDASPFVRKEALKSLMAIATTSLVTNGLMSAMGAKVNTNPRNADFMKSKFGNTRLDPNGGFQQYIVAATRLLTGETQSSTSGKISHLGKDYTAPTRVGLILGLGNKNQRSFLENKASPVAGFVDDILSARTPDSNGLGGMVSNNYNADLINKFVPMMVNDMIDILKDDPNHLPLVALGATGMGLQTYAPPKSKSRFRLSVR